MKPDWYALLLRSEEDKQHGASGPLPAASFARELVWTQLPMPTAAPDASGPAINGGGAADGKDQEGPKPRRPLPRYEHGAALVGKDLYVVAGNYGARVGPGPVGRGQGTSGATARIPGVGEGMGGGMTKALP